MKKNLLVLMVAFFALAFTSLNAQVCVPDPAAVAQGPGVYPDTIDGLPDAIVGSIYNEVVTMVVPTDTVVDGGEIDPLLTGQMIALTIESIQVDSVGGLPTGFNYACDPIDCDYDGGTSGCMLINGQPQMSQMGTYPLTVYITQNVDMGTGPFGVPGTVDYYTITVTDQVGFILNKVTDFGIVALYPSPMTENAQLTFRSMKHESVEYRLFDLLGNVVDYQMVGAKEGINTIQIEKGNLPSGIYTVQITNGSNAVLQKFVIAE